MSSSSSTGHPQQNDDDTSTTTHTPPPFFVSRLPTGFTFGEICSAPKAQPQVEISRQDAIAKCLRSGPPLLGLGRRMKLSSVEERSSSSQQGSHHEDDKNDEDIDKEDEEEEERKKKMMMIVSRTTGEVPLLLEVQTTSKSTCTISSNAISSSLKEHRHKEENQDRNDDISSSTTTSHPSFYHLTKTKIKSSSKNTDNNEEERSDDHDDDDCDNNNNNSFYPPPSIQYHILHTGNFVRVATMPGRLYWLAQNSHQHLTSDWKLHISCDPNDIPIVWNLIMLPVFFEHPTIATVGCKAVLSASRDDETGEFTTSTDAHWPAEQTGREITIYLFVDDEAYSQRLLGEQYSSSSSDSSDSDADEDSTAAADDDDKENNINANKKHKNKKNKNKNKNRRWNKDHLWTGDDRKLSDYWRHLLKRASNFSSQDLIHLVESIQQRMDFYHIQTRGCASGDLALTRNVSIRNEAYTNGATVHAWHQHRKEMERQYYTKSMKQKAKQQLSSVSKQSTEGNKNTTEASPSFFSWAYWNGSTAEKVHENNDTTTPPSRKDDQTFLYPLNDWGWNAAEQPLPGSLKGLIKHFNPTALAEDKFYQGCKDFGKGVLDDDDENVSGGNGTMMKKNRRRNASASAGGGSCTC